MRQFFEEFLAVVAYFAILFRDQSQGRQTKCNLEYVSCLLNQTTSKFDLSLVKNQATAAVQHFLPSPRKMRQKTLSHRQAEKT